LFWFVFDWLIYCFFDQFPLLQLAGRCARVDWFSHARPAIVGIDGARGVVVLPAPAQRLVVELRFEQDGTVIASRVVRHVRRKDGQAAHAAMAKLVHIFIGS
jgi:hypothetical protein